MEASDGKIFGSEEGGGSIDEKRIELSNLWGSASHIYGNSDMARSGLIEQQALLGNDEGEVVRSELWLGMPTMPKVPGRDALFDARRGSQIERENVSECAGCQDTTPESELIVRSINGQRARRTRQPSQHVDI